MLGVRAIVLRRSAETHSRVRFFFVLDAPTRAQLKFTIVVVTKDRSFFFVLLQKRFVYVACTLHFLTHYFCLSFFRPDVKSSYVFISHLSAEGTRDANKSDVAVALYPLTHRYELMRYFPLSKEGLI